MAEERTDLNQDEPQISADRSETAGFEMGAPTTYATNTLGEYPNYDAETANRDLSPADYDPEQSISTTGGVTEVVNADDEPEQIRAQIEQTRTEMSETINAIQEKLSFDNIAAQVKEGVSEQISQTYESAKEVLFTGTAERIGNFMARMNHTINDLTEDYAPAVRDASRRVVSTARSNPIPLALIGLGVGILLINRFRSQRQTTSYRYDDGNDEYEQINADYDYTAGQGKSGVRQVYNKVGGAANSVYETASSAAGSAYEGVSGAANTAYQGVSSAAGTAYKQVGNLGNQTRKAARWTQETYADQFEANPLAIGAVALALGAVVGLALPTTQIEGEYLGEARNNILQQAQDKATEVFDKVQQVAGNVVEKAQQAAGSVVDQAQQAAGDVAQTVQDEVKAKGLTA